MELALMHVGGPVADLDAAIADHDRLGAGPWAVAPVQLFHTYDAAAGRVRRQRIRMAFGRLPGGGVMELTEAAGDPHHGPQWDLLQRGEYLSHTAYWCRDVPGTLPGLLAGGVTVETAPVTEASGLRDADRIDLADLLPHLRTCHLRLPSGARVELVDTRQWGAPLRAFCGGDIEQVIDPPPAHLRAE